MDVDSKMAAIRNSRWISFTKWYAGDEAINRVPGQGIPTLARVLVAEKWEKKVLYEDFTIMESMILLGQNFSEETLLWYEEQKALLLEQGDDFKYKVTDEVKDDVMIGYEAALNQSTGAGM